MIEDGSNSCLNCGWIRTLPYTMVGLKDDVVDLDNAGKTESHAYVRHQWNGWGMTFVTLCLARC